MPKLSDARAKRAMVNLLPLSINFMPLLLLLPNIIHENGGQYIKYISPGEIKRNMQFTLY